MLEIHILHAGITHPSPYFYNFCLNLDKYAEIKYTIDPNLPTNAPKDKGIIYFNRLKRFYDSDDINSVDSFLEKIKYLKSIGWKIVWTVHNFFPIDRTITNVDEFITEEFIKKCDLVFTLSEYLKQQIKNIYGINAINHGMGFNKLDNRFNNNLVNNFKKDKFVYTFVGNIYKYKMLDKIVENFNKIDNAYLIIAGKESKNAHVDVENLIIKNKNIFFFNGFIGSEDWKKLENITDVFVNIYDLDLPAFKYGFFPSNYINIYNTGIKCISPRHKAIEEMMDEEQMIYYDFHDKNGLLIAMKYAKNNDLCILENNVNNKYNWDKVIECFVENCMRLFYENQI